MKLSFMGKKPATPLKNGKNRTPRSEERPSGLSGLWVNPDITEELADILSTCRGEVEYRVERGVTVRD